MDTLGSSAIATAFFVSQENAIGFGILEGFTWIRVEGKGSFLQSPALKECAEQRLAGGEVRLVIDLEACSGMDSTFMGYLAGLSTRLRKLGGWVQIASPGERNRASLEDLGLDCLLDISPPDAPWVGRVEAIRGGLKPFASQRLPSLGERSKHVLESHETLAGTNERNAKRFAQVLEVLRQDRRNADSGD